MTKVLITGATGNVGVEVIRCLNNDDNNVAIYAGVRDLEADQSKLSNYNVQLVKFDFTDIASYKPAINFCDVVFLLRPPQISDVKKYFEPLLQAAIESKVKHIVFLSVQGVENSKIIPHHKIEQLIVESKIPYTFLRPAYFMQNFTTTLRNDLTRNRLIFLPAGNARFTLIDVRDIGAVSATIIANPSQHAYKAYDLTSQEKLTFTEMASKLSRQLGYTIRYKSPNLIYFFTKKGSEKMPVMFILVLIMLHYLPRYQKEPQITDAVEKITGKKPVTFDQFIRDYKNLLV